MSTPPVPTAATGERVDARGVVGRIARAGAWSVAGYASSAASVFLVGILVARELGPDAFGRYAFFVWVLRLAPTLLAFGVPVALNRIVAEHLGADRPGQAVTLVRASLRFHLFVAPLPMAALAWWTWRTEAHALLAAAMGLGVAAVLASLDLDGIFSAWRRFRALGVIAAVTAIVQAALAIVGRSLGVGWESYVVLHVVAVVLGVVLAASCVRPSLETRGQAGAPVEERRRFFRFAGAMAILVVIDSVLWGRPELLFLEVSGTSRDLGFYSAGLRLASLAVVLPIMAARALIPEFSWLRGGGHEETLRSVYPKVCRMLAVLSAPMALGGAALAGPLVTSLYGGEFAGAAGPTAVLLAGSFVNALAGPATAAVLTGPRPRLVAEVGAATMVVNLVLAAVIIPTHGAMGAAVVNVGVQVVAIIVGIAYSDRVLGLRYPVMAVAKALAAAAAAAGVAALVAAVTSGIAAVIAGVLAGGIVFVPLVLALGVITIDEVMSLGERDARDSSEVAA